jgi:hypothetical protein
MPLKIYAIGIILMNWLFEGLGVVTFQSDIFDKVIFEGFGCSEKCFSDPISIFPVNLTDDALKKNVFSEAL